MGTLALAGCSPAPTPEPPGPAGATEAVRGDATHGEAAPAAVNLTLDLEREKAWIAK